MFFTAAKKAQNMKPALNKNILPEVFLNYYWLKDELVDFCKSNALSISGSKQELAQQIVKYLKTGEVVNKSSHVSAGKPKLQKILTLETTISKYYRNDELHRAFFKKVIGKHFKFNVNFMKWMKNNSGKTYQAAVDEWNRLYAEKKAGKKYGISSQFEYNQYIRDFFIANPGRKLQEAIACWKYKKAKPGTNKYEVKDLKALKK